MNQLSQIINDDLLKIRTVYNNNGYDVRIVGGAVRDIIAGNTPNDVDLCTDATPEKQIEICQEAGFYVIPTGLQHGTITVIPSMIKNWKDGAEAIERGEAYEITTLRTETDNDGRWATTSYTKDWIGDLARRDFTCNAMMMMFDGEIIDPFNGQSDLRNGIIRFVGNPVDRIQEDYLRVLRFFRFSGRFGRNDILPNTVKAITDNLDGFAKLRDNGNFLISGERIHSEMMKIMIGPNSEIQLANMAKIGVLDAIDFNINSNDISMIKYIRNNSNTPIASLAFLLDTKNDIKKIQKRWSFTLNELKLLNWLIANKTMHISRNTFEDFLVNGIDRDWINELAAITFTNSIWDEVKDWVIPVFPITGDDLIEIGFSSGTVLGRTLKNMRDIWVASRFSLTKSELMNRLV